MSPLRGATIGWGLYSAANGKYVLQKLIKVIEVGSYQDYRIFITLTTLASVCPPVSIYILYLMLVLYFSSLLAFSDANVTELIHYQFLFTAADWIH